MFRGDTVEAEVVPLGGGERLLIGVRLGWLGRARLTASQAAGGLDFRGFRKGRIGAGLGFALVASALTARSRAGSYSSGATAGWNVSFTCAAQSLQPERRWRTTTLFSSRDP